MNKPLKRAFLNTEDGQILYRIAGEGDPLVLLHQNQTSSNEYLELMSILSKNRCVIAMDFLGFGDSDKPPRMYSIEDYAQTVLLLLDKLGINKTDILGNHTGAFVAGELAVAYPEKINKLILSNPVVFGEEGKSALLKRFEQGFEIKADGSHLMERWAARTQYVNSAKLNHRLVLDDLKCFGYPLYAVWAVANYCLNMEQRFSQIKCPTLIIWGTVDIKQFEKLGLFKAEKRVSCLKVIPHAKMFDIEGGTICMMNQMPEEISQIVTEFLDSSEITNL
ncbi:alpha/beta hydrolase fold protein [Richelia sinica FACHB-800]|uniref:Alpha/beta hydrolase fold protein n=1 Tax=Richelia sinica FACHB-800 TaxID=1357546 RepID=A0A975Y5L8_9NOST|nr:alpha/beta hydrolase [Richelia sinica]MBD2663222.1 alpha/beta hydrolase [Richelia sinica FACHB-800]QXE24375.1 alpha/beta hydrolase fold protein [Richelia sinica FACHB-800]